MAVKGIYFDLYGTLYKYGDMNQAWDNWLSTLYRSFKNYDNGLTREYLSSACKGFFSKEDPPNDSSNLSVFERRIKRLSIELNYSIPDEKIKIAAKENLDAWQKHISLDEQTVPLLENLKGKYILGLISNFDHPPHVKDLLYGDKISHYFSSITISGEVGFKKPDKRIFDSALFNSAFNRSEILFIGDSDDDIIGASNSGLIPVLINRNSNTEVMLDYNIIESKAKHINSDKVFSITNLTQLLDLIDWINN